MKKDPNTYIANLNWGTVLFHKGEIDKAYEYFLSAQKLNSQRPEDYVGMGKIPMWIDEGVAQWEEEGKRELVKQRLIEILDHHSPIPMNRMMTLNIGKIDNEFIVELYYLQAVSIIDFLFTRFGAERFIYLCRQLRDGKTIDDALQFAFPTTIRNTEALESEWMEYLQVNNK